MRRAGPAGRGGCGGGGRGGVVLQFHHSHVVLLEGLLGVLARADLLHEGAVDAEHAGHLHDEGELRAGPPRRQPGDATEEEAQGSRARRPLHARRATHPRHAAVNKLFMSCT